MGLSLDCLDSIIFPLATGLQSKEFKRFFKTLLEVQVDDRQTHETMVAIIGTFNELK